MEASRPYHLEVHCAHSPARRPVRRRALRRPSRGLLVERSGHRRRARPRRARRGPVQRRRAVGRRVRRGHRRRHGRRGIDRDLHRPRWRSPSCRRTVIEEGSGDPVEAGELVTYALTAFSADTGEKLGSIGYGEDPVLPAQISPDNPVGQVLGLRDARHPRRRGLPARPTRTPARSTSSTSSPSSPTPRGASRRSPSTGMPEVDAGR